MSKLLTSAERNDLLPDLLNAGWRLSEDELNLERTFRFNSFAEAFGWMTVVAIRADKMNHHPDWQNSYNRVRVSLTTHDVGGLTALDVKLANVMQSLFARHHPTDV